MEERKNVSSLIDISNSISSSFRKLKFVTIACLAGVFATAVVCVVYTVTSVSDLGSKIYVLDKGQVMTASRQDVSISRQDEVVAQSERFHTLFFTATPNRDVMQRNIEAAMQLCGDRTAYNYYNDLQESGFYRRIGQSNAVQEIVIDSVRVNMRTYPYKAVTYASLYVTRSSLIVKSLLVTQMSMVDVPRDQRNLNGLKIEQFEVVRKEEVDKRNRVN